MTTKTRPKKVHLLLQEKDESLTFRLPTEMKSLISSAAKEKSIKMTAYVIRAVRERLKADGYCK